jgi:hypothetical protein
VSGYRYPLGVDDKVDDLGVLSSPLQSLPVLIAWGRCVRFVEFPDLFTPDHCLREAGAGGSNPLTPTISRSIYAIFPRC